MKIFLAMALLVGTVYAAPILPAAHAQTGAAGCRDSSCLQKRTRASRSFSVVSYQGSDKVCVQWVANPEPGLFSLKTSTGGSDAFSRGYLGKAPSQIVGKYTDNGISFYTLERTPSGGLAPRFIGGLPMTKNYDADGCLTKISYERSMFEYEVTGGARYSADRVVINRREDGLITFRFVNELTGNNDEVARYVYERVGDYRFTSAVSNARVADLPQTNSYVPGLGGSFKKRRRGSVSSFSVVDNEKLCTIAGADDQTASKEACLKQDVGFVATE